MWLVSRDKLCTISIQVMKAFLMDSLFWDNLPWDNLPWDTGLNSPEITFNGILCRLTLRYQAHILVQGSQILAINLHSIACLE